MNPGAKNISSGPSVPAWKRGLDITLVLLASPILVPLGLLIGLVIKVVSPGPVLFRQGRVGYLERHFMCLKFRTMVVNADTGVHEGHLERLMKSDRPMVKLDAKDSRLIRGGRWLRASGLDELPQVINVLRGEMSLVGPRPCLPYEYDKYLPHQRERCATLPGLTGLWQVSGKNRTTFEEMIDMDVYYARHKSLLMDLRIIALTIPSIVMQLWETKMGQKTSRRTEAAEATGVGSRSQRR
jgi:lipopolysaccharide/colanic/teichoic acid biosynthesis glycosyltransferase